ncbi:MAG TPA: hypothetical protein PK637_11500 [Flavobacteriales bacterium]|nr:hypothetical protein [Flavobacteriales bacterium]HRE97385.1 hypothetical protein [Flavobacteriales bacterium]HRJ35889.1 hypothetical protein [Flavobacteriales bacterium]HRJ40010.1 hypothetical protein [Flavobacteriales bacterium]
MRFALFMAIFCLFLSACKKDPGERSMDRNMRLLCREKWVVKSVSDSFVTTIPPFSLLEFEFKSEGKLVVSEPGLFVHGSFTLIQSTNKVLSIKANTVTSLSNAIIYFNRIWTIQTLDRRKMIWGISGLDYIRAEFVHPDE